MTPLEGPGPGFRERRFTAKDGLELTFRDYGDPLSKACPLLCLAGLTRNSKDFAEVAKRQAEVRRVIALDYRGRGRSAYDPDWHRYRPEIYLDDVLQVAAATNLHRVVVCGTSLGGLLAMGLAAAMPCLLAGVILNDVGPEIPAAAIGGILAMLAAARPQNDWPEAVADLQKTLPQLNFSGRSSWQSFAEASYRRVVRDHGIRAQVGRLDAQRRALVRRARELEDVVDGDLVLDLPSGHVLLDVDREQLLRGRGRVLGDRGARSRQPLSRAQRTDTPGDWRPGRRRRARRCSRRRERRAQRWPPP